MKVLYSVGFVISVIAWVINLYRSFRYEQDTLPLWVSVAFMWIFNILMKIN